MRIAASLIRAEDNSLIWSQSFHEKVGDVFVTQERIAEEVGAKGRIKLDAWREEARKFMEGEA